MKLIIRSFLSLLSFLVLSNAGLIAQSNIWANKIEGNILNMQSQESTTGFQYLAVQYKDSIQYHYGNDILTLHSIDSFTVCIIKIDQNQIPIATYQYTTTYDFFRNLIQQMEIDGQGNIYIAGNHSESIIDQFQDTLVTRNDINAFLMKLDSNLNLIEFHAIGGGNNSDFIREIDVQQDGRILLSGGINRTFDFDLSEGFFNLSGNNAGSPFAAVYDAALNLITAVLLDNNLTRQFASEFSYGAEVDQEGNVFMVNNIRDTLTFTFDSIQVTIIPYDDRDFLLSKWNVEGQLVDYIHLGSTSREEYIGMELDDEGNIHLWIESGDLFYADSIILENGESNRIWLVINDNLDIAEVRSYPTLGADISTRLAFNGEDFFLFGKSFAKTGFNFQLENDPEDFFALQFYLSKYSKEGTLLAANAITQAGITQIYDFALTPGNQLLMCSTHNRTSRSIFNPTPEGNLQVQSGRTGVLSKYCFPNTPDLSISLACQDDQIQIELTGNVESNKYINLGSGSLLGSENSITVPFSNDTLLAVSIDRNRCPVYNQINLIEADCASTAVNNILTRTTAIYPNPVSNVIFIESEQAIKEIVIYTLLGQVVKQKYSINQKMDLDVSDLLSGSYIIQLLDENQNYLFKKIQIAGK